MIVNMNIPAVKEINLPGQNSPPNPETAYRVASMNAHVIGTPSNINAALYVLAQSHSKGPFTCTQTTICPKRNIEKDNTICL